MDTAGIEKMMQTELAVGVNTLNIHEGADVNPFINFATAPELVRLLSDYSRFLHAANGSLKLYYTTRELSNHVDVLRILRLLGGEIIDESAPAVNPFSEKGFAWLQEHLGRGYQPWWGNPNPSPIAQDASMCNADIGAGQSHLR